MTSEALNSVGRYQSPGRSWLMKRRTCPGHVTINPGGSVPVHSHVQEEVYININVHGKMHIDDQTADVKPGDYVYISPNANHLLKNTSKENMIMVFCYAPKSIVDHWQEELEGRIN